MDSKKQESTEEIKPNKRKKKNKLPSGNIVKNSLTAAEKIYTSCGKSMHKQRAKVKTYVLAIPMLQTETHLSDSCRCFCCGTTATAQSEKKLLKIALATIIILLSPLWHLFVISLECQVLG